MNRRAASHFKLPPDLLKLVPVCGNDPRQENLISTLSKNEDLVANVSRGYPASSPDFGFLQWLIIAAFRAGLERRDAITAAIANGVQCVESIIARPIKEQADAFEVIFVSYDDYGKYRFRTIIDFTVKSYPLPPIVERMQRMETVERKKS